MLFSITCTTFLMFFKLQTVVQGEFEFEVRFQSHPVQDSGVVEIYYNDRWWLIASSKWTFANTRALCRSFGYADGKSFSLVNSEGHPVNRSFTCKGTEKAIQYCKQEAFDDVADRSITHAVQITCTGLEENHLRLVGGLTVMEGRAEIYHNGEWGTICLTSSYISGYVARVLCRSAGFDSKTAYYKPQYLSRLPKSTRRIWIDDLVCHGSESEINECQKVSWGNSCRHSDDVYLYCYSEYDIRLSNNVLYGNLEVYRSGRFEQLCLDYSPSYSKEANLDVACRSLGFTDPVVGQYSEDFVRRGLMTDEIRCKGKEKSIFDCEMDDLEIYEHCYHFWVVFCMLDVAPLDDEIQRKVCEYQCSEECYPNEKVYGSYNCPCTTDDQYGRWCQYSNYTGVYNHESDTSVAAIIIGSACGLIFLLGFIITFICIRNKRKKQTSGTAEVAYTENQVTLNPVQIGSAVAQTVLPTASMINAPATSENVSHLTLPLNPPPYTE